MRTQAIAPKTESSFLDEAIESDREHYAVTHQRSDRRARDAHSRQQHQQPNSGDYRSRKSCQRTQTRIAESAQAINYDRPTTPNSRGHQQPTKGAGRGDEALAKQNS